MAIWARLTVRRKRGLAPSRPHVETARTPSREVPVPFFNGLLRDDKPPAVCAGAHMPNIANIWYPPFGHLRCEATKRSAATDAGRPRRWRDVSPDGLAMWGRVGGDKPPDSHSVAHMPNIANIWYPPVGHLRWEVRKRSGTADGVAKKRHREEAKKQRSHPPRHRESPSATWGRTDMNGAEVRRAVEAGEHEMAETSLCLRLKAGADDGTDRARQTPAEIGRIDRGRQRWALAEASSGPMSRPTRSTNTAS